MNRKVLSFLLTLCLIICYIPVSAYTLQGESITLTVDPSAESSAETRTASGIYRSIADAQAVAQNGDTIVLCSDITEHVVFTSNQCLTLDLDGNILFGSVKNSGNTVIKSTSATTVHYFQCSGNGAWVITGSSVSEYATGVREFERGTTSYVSLTGGCIIGDGTDVPEETYAVVTNLSGNLTVSGINFVGQFTSQYNTVFCAASGNAVIEDSLFAGASGKCVSIEKGAYSVFVNTDFIGNTCNSGSMMFVNSGNTSVTGGSILSNYSTARSLVSDYSYFTMSGVTLSKNTLNAGGSVIMSDHGHLYIDDCLFSENVGYEAQCINVSNAEAELSRLSICDNTASGLWCLGSDQSTSCTDIIIENNSGTNDFTGLDYVNGSLMLSGKCIIRNNINLTDESHIDLKLGGNGYINIGTNGLSSGSSIYLNNSNFMYFKTFTQDGCGQYANFFHTSNDAYKVCADKNGALKLEPRATTQPSAYNGYGFGVDTSDLAEPVITYQWYELKEKISLSDISGKSIIASSVNNLSDSQDPASYSLSGSSISVTGTSIRMLMLQIGSLDAEDPWLIFESDANIEALVSDCIYEDGVYKVRGVNGVAGWVLYSDSDFTLNNIAVTTYTSLAGVTGSALTGYENDKVYCCIATINGSEIVSLDCNTLPSGSVIDISLSCDSISLRQLESIQLTATVSPEDAVDKSCTWTSSDPLIVAVSDTGMVTAVSPGSATITVKSNNSGVTDTCTVTVLPKLKDEYEITGISIKTLAGEELTDIPNTEFWVSISVTHNVKAGDAQVLVETTDEEGRFIGLSVFMLEDMSVGSKIKFSFIADNTDGRIANVKAFVVSSLQNLTPLGEAVSLR